MSTPRTLIRLAFGALTLLSPGDSIDSHDEDDAFAILNMMLGTWSNKRRRALSSVEENFTLTIGQESYTIGTGGDFNTERPVKIEDAFVRDSAGQDHPVKIILDRAEYTRLIDKDIQARPFALYFERLFTISRGNIILNRAPDAAETLYLIMWKNFAKFTSLTQEVVLPDGYEELIYSQLAIRLAAHYGKAISAELAAVAKDSADGIDTVNTEIPITISDCTEGVGDGGVSGIIDARSGNE